MMKCYDFPKTNGFKNNFNKLIGSIKPILMAPPSHMKPSGLLPPRAETKNELNIPDFVDLRPLPSRDNETHQGSYGHSWLKF